jgi:8-oxo-dGTP diphosphatase
MSNFVIRCRGVIIHDGKLLTVTHQHDPSFVCLPGGHLEAGEDPVECLKREIIEELGVTPTIGRLLYVNTFVDKKRDVQPIEFFFEITNSEEFVNFTDYARTHEHEIESWHWMDSNDYHRLLPEKFAQDFRNKTIDKDKTIFIKG